MREVDETTRDIWDLLTILRRRWWLIALITAVAVGAAAGYTYRQPKLYKSSMKIVVGQGQGIFLPEVGNVAEQFTQTMSSLIQTDIVAERVIQQLRLRITPSTLLSDLRVVTKPETAVLEVSYVDTDPSRGTRILATVGAVFTQLVDERLAPANGTANATAVQTAVSVSIFDFAHSLPGSIQPKPARNVSVAGILGLLFGFVGAFVRERFDDTIRSLDEAERTFGQATTATFPVGSVGYSPFVPGRSPKRGRGVAIELALQRLRASIVWPPESREARSLLVTSARPDEGKLTIASNLALSLAAEGHRVIVVEADLRRPALHRFLALPAPSDAIGIDAIALGRMDLSQALVEVPPPGPPFFPSNGDQPTRSGEDNQSAPWGRLLAILAAPGRSRPVRLGSEQTLRLINELRRHADYVVFDAPPLLVVTDAYPFVPFVDVVVAVVRNGRSVRSGTEEMSRTLERLGAKRLELVVTDVEPTFRATHYGPVISRSTIPRRSVKSEQ